MIRESRITMTADGLKVPNKPVITFIEGDGTGPDIWAATCPVIEAAVQKAYKGKREIAWKEVLAGEKAFQETGQWLPEKTVKEIKKYHVGIKGPLTTPVGGGIRSLNVALRQQLDLYVCQRPVRWFKGVPSPMRHPEKVDMVIFRENTEDVYAGLEVKKGSRDAKKIIQFLKDEMGWNIRSDSGIGIKPISVKRTQRLVRAAIQYAIENKRKSVTLVHKGNIQKFTEGAFREWGYQTARREFPDHCVSWEECGGKVPRGKILIKDAIADIFLQQIITRGDEFDVIATMNLNGDYISDALAAQVGGIGIAPGANINYEKGIGLFEATHGTAPKYANLDKVNPGSLILSGVMMLTYMGWTEAAERIVSGLEKAIARKEVTYDFHRLMKGGKKLKCSEFGQAIIKSM